MSPFLIHSYPKWAEVIIRTLRIGSYALAANTGLAALLFTPSSLKPEMFVIVGSMLLFGTLCAVASALKRYVIEWVSLFFLAGGISVYTSAVWISAIANPKAVAGASIFTVLIFLMLIRAVDLTVYWLRNVRAVKQEQRLGNDS